MGYVHGSRLDPQAAKDIVCGRACALSSTFHLSYNLLLNAMRWIPPPATRSPPTPPRNPLPPSPQPATRCPHPPQPAATLAPLNAMPPPPSPHPFHRKKLDIRVGSRPQT